VISPCVAFNNHEGSTKSYLYTRQHEVKVTVADFVPPAAEITASIPDSGVTPVVMHDGSRVRFSTVPALLAALRARGPTPSPSRKPAASAVVLSWSSPSHSLSLLYKSGVRTG